MINRLKPLSNLDIQEFPRPETSILWRKQNELYIGIFQKLFADGSTEFGPPHRYIRSDLKVTEGGIFESASALLSLLATIDDIARRTNLPLVHMVGTTKLISTFDRLVLSNIYQHGKISGDNHFYQASLPFPIEFSGILSKFLIKEVSSILVASLRT